MQFPGGGVVYSSPEFVLERIGMKFSSRRLMLGLLFSALTFGFSAPALAWSHQGHMLITRLAALRIINDPEAPQGLRDFLKANMPASMDDCEHLATVEAIGGDPKNLTGFDAAATLPDRIQMTPDGKKPVEPYKATEFQMHFMDMEWLSKDPTYKADFSNRPTLDAVSRDYHDPRWKLAGYLPFRVAECYQNVTNDFAGHDKPVDNDTMVRWAGYLAHYLERCPPAAPLHGGLPLSHLSRGGQGARGTRDPHEEQRRPGCRELQVGFRGHQRAWGDRVPAF